jgi:hypothetical protein
MTSFGNKKIGAEFFALGILLAALSVSLVMTAFMRRAEQKQNRNREAANDALPLDILRVENLSKEVTEPSISSPELHDLMVGELRVIAIGSAYPIPYDAEVCPFSNIEQPAMNQLDRDGDGITDDWELTYNFNKYVAADAALDSDGDGFTNLEEFTGKTNPRDISSHPPFAEKLRFIERKDIPFFLVFQGFTEQQDGTVSFQLNNPDTGKSHFAEVGDAVENVVVQRFEPAENGEPARLFVMRNGVEIKLIRGETALDPESKAELINILDRSPIIVTMGALLSLHSDEYTVLGVHADRVILRDMRTGKVYDIVGLADGER